MVDVSYGFIAGLIGKNRRAAEKAHAKVEPGKPTPKTVNSSTN